MKESDIDVMITEEGVDEDGAWAAVVMTAPPGYLIEVPGRRGNEWVETFEFTVLKKGRR